MTLEPVEHPAAVPLFSRCVAPAGIVLCFCVRVDRFGVELDSATSDGRQEQHGSKRG